MVQRGIYVSPNKKANSGALPTEVLEAQRKITDYLESKDKKYLEEALNLLQEEINKRNSDNY